jgi:hypothetical protein
VEISLVRRGPAGVFTGKAAVFDTPSAIVRINCYTYGRGLACIFPLWYTGVNTPRLLHSQLHDLLAEAAYLSVFDGVYLLDGQASGARGGSAFASATRLSVLI